MNLCINGSLIYDCDPITSLLKLVSGSDKDIATKNAAANCFVCFNKIVLTVNVSGDEKNVGSIKFNTILTIAAGFQTCVHDLGNMAVIARNIPWLSFYNNLKKCNKTTIEIDFSHQSITEINSWHSGENISREKKDVFPGIQVNLIL